MATVPVDEAGVRAPTSNEGPAADMNQDAVKNHETLSHIVGSEEGSCNQAVREHQNSFVTSSQEVVKVLEKVTTEVTKDGCAQVQSSVLSGVAWLENLMSHYFC